MFKTLATMAKHPTDSSVDVQISQESFDVLITNMADITPTAQAQQKREQTRRELQALIGAIETHGASKALLEFATHNGTLLAIAPSLRQVDMTSPDDLTATETAQLLTELKAITIHDAPATEKLGLLQQIVVFLGILSGIVPGIIWYGIFTVWNKYVEGDDGEKKDHKIATVVPYQTIVKYLQEMCEVPAILTAVVAMKLPTTEDESDAYFQHLESKLAPLNKFGIHYRSDDGTTTSDLADPIHGDIRQLGYTEHSLKNIAELAKHCESIEPQLKNLEDRLEKNSADPSRNTKTQDDIHYVAHAELELEFILHVTLVRMNKVLMLVKHTCQSIEHFYAKG
jgi:hypothetical protein